MSIQGLNWCIKQKTDTPTTKLVLFILSNYADENGSCYPSEKKLAELVGVSDRQIRRCLAYLAKNNLISVQARIGTSNRYFLTLDTDVLPTAEADVRRDRTPTSYNTKENTKANTKENFYSKNFEVFWNKYPRKVGKYNAAKSFAKAEQDVSFVEILKGLDIFIKLNQNTETRFIPHAATWLNGKRYLDEKPKASKSLNNIAG